MREVRSLDNAKCTILIPTFNRPDYVHRILDYYNKNQISYEIIVGDSSTEENKFINKKIIDLYPSLKIKYFDNFSQSVNLIIKISNLLNLIKTQYCVICADDDFIIPSAIEEAIYFLENHRDYVAAAGLYTSFKTEIIANNKKKIQWSMIYLTKSNNSRSLISRLVFNFANYTPTFYHVHQTNVLRFAFNKTLECVDDIRFTELLTSMLTVMHGKIKHLNILF